jgi:hypothetical protein
VQYLSLRTDCVAKVGGTSSDRQKRAILESEGVILRIKIPYSALIWKKFSSLQGPKSFCNTIGQKQTHAPQQTIRSFPNLERYVEAHPELFVQAIAWTYKRKDGATDPAEFQVPPERIETMAERGHKLLDAIERIPGHNHLGELEATRLATWIAAVRQGGPHRKGYASLSPKPIREFHRSKCGSRLMKNCRELWNSD